MPVLISAEPHGRPVFVVPRPTHDTRLGSQLKTDHDATPDK
jgi:hypothetical protein